MKFFLQCSECNKIYDIQKNLMLCPNCNIKGHISIPFKGVLELLLESKPQNAEDILSFLPFDKSYYFDINLGYTPLLKLRSLNDYLGFENLYFKDERANRTLSIKDRAAALMGAACKFFQAKSAVLYSDDLAVSCSAISSLLNIPLKVFGSSQISQSICFQCVQYGSSIYIIKPDNVDDYSFTITYAQQTDSYMFAEAYNPYSIEGFKTVSLEIYEQLFKHSPDFVFVYVKDGTTLSGIYKGFRDLKQFGYIDLIPTIYAVQSQSNHAFYDGFKKDGFIPLTLDTTNAQNMLSLPKNGIHALQNLKKHWGDSLLVSDEEVQNAQKILASKTGILVDIPSATAFAGFLSVKKYLNKKAKVVIIITGSGLNDLYMLINSAKINWPIVTNINQVK